MTVPLVTSLLAAEAWSHGYGAIRYQSGSGQTAYPSGKPHLARDFFFPPGTQIFSPKSGLWDHWAPSNEDGSLTMGYVGVLHGDDGNVYRFIHIAVDGRNPALVKGARVVVGTPIGFTSLHNLGASDSHLHFDVAYNGTRFDPLDEARGIGVDGFNALTHGSLNTASRSLAVLTIAGALAVGAGTFYWLRRNPR